MATMTPATATGGTSVSQVTQHAPLLCSDVDPLLCSDSLECSDNGLVVGVAATGTMVAA